MQSKTVDKTKLMTVKQYADKIGKSTTWVYRLIDNKEIKSENIAGVIFIHL